MMGFGFLTKHTKQMICALLVVLAVVYLYASARSSTAGPSPYETIDSYFRDQGISFVPERGTYPVEVETVQVTIRNDAEDGAVVPVLGVSKEWVLERWVDGMWQSLHSRLEPVEWAFLEEDCTDCSIPSGIVIWGGEQRYLCRISYYYSLPLEAGTYRIVFPSMEHLHRTGAMSAEFDVV